MLPACLGNLAPGHGRSISSRKVPFAGGFNLKEKISMWIYPVGKKWGAAGIQTPGSFLYKGCKVNHLGIVTAKTDGGFRNNEFYG